MLKNVVENSPENTPAKKKTFHDVNSTLECILLLFSFPIILGMGKQRNLGDILEILCAMFFNFRSVRNA